MQTGNVAVNNKIGKETYLKYNVKRGLRNKDGTGVVAGITHIGDVLGYEMIDGVKIPTEGRLLYRGYELSDLVNGFLADKRPGFEEIAYLLIFGDLPNQKKLKN
jgi:citrate synthase